MDIPSWQRSFAPEKPQNFSSDNIVANERCLIEGGFISILFWFLLVIVHVRDHCWNSRNLWNSHTHTHTNTQTHAHTLTHSVSLTHTRTHTQSHTHTHTLSLTLTHTQTLRHTHTHSHTLSLTHTRTHTHTHTHKDRRFVKLLFSFYSTNNIRKNILFWSFPGIDRLFFWYERH